MAFNLDQKPYSEFSLNTPVYSKPLEEGILGEAQMNGTILVSDKMENIDQINNTIEHESIHTAAQSVQSAASSLPVASRYCPAAQSMQSAKPFKKSARPWKTSGL